ncbi:ATP-binding protein [Desulfosarcina cetonica]|uniref:ATP-binding protein n=1 Tax=Desulfosarcina cetonica TaxID=90730 RepID=UPI001FED6580|nr:ATP-binding protein [Desulfosarcina cetonica]
MLARVETHLALRRLHQQLEQQNAQLLKESAERLQVERELREANDLNRKIFEAAAMGVVAYNGCSGQCVMANPAAGKIVNASEDQLTGQNFRRLESWRTSGLLAMAEQVLDTGTKREQEVHTVTSFGREVWMECRMNRFLIRGEPHLLLLIYDVTEQKHFQETLKQAKEAAEEANMAKSQFLANMSHEIRTPLNAVIGFSDLLSSVVEDPKQKSYIESVQTAGKSLLRLINDILDLSKIEAGRLELSCSPTDVRTVINEVEQIFSQQALQKNVRFITDVDPGLPAALFLDEIRLRQILINLVGNAVKFTEKGHIQLTVSITDQKTAGDLLDIDISVEDTGIGIPEHDTERIFESFKQQTGQSSSKFGGTGLGLSICRRLAEMMGGTVSVRSVAGKGSTFSVGIRNIAISHKAIPAVEERSGDETIRFESAKVLVVDDVASNSQLISEILSRVNLEFLTAGNGSEALKIAEAYQPDVILMDLWMPVMDGIEATGRLKVNARTKTIPVIAVSASIFPDHSASLVEKGFDGFLSKPFKTDQLFSELSKYLKIAKEDNPASSATKVALDFSAPQMALNLRELIEIIDSDLMRQWEDLQKMIPMKTVRKFGKELETLGLKYTVPFLSDCGRNLLLHTDNFDVQNMKIKIDEFPNIVDELKSLKEVNHGRG